MFKPGKLSFGSISILLLTTFVIGLGIILRNSSFLPQPSSPNDPLYSSSSEITFSPNLLNWENNSLTPYPGPGDDANKLIPTEAFTYPPLCTFSEDTKFSENNLSESQEISFSEPTPVLTGTGTTVSIDLIEWLPDNQQILIVRDSSDGSQPIELFNIASRSSQIIGTRKSQSPHTAPIWLPALNAVVYSEKYLSNPETNSQRAEYRLWISSAGSQNSQILVDQLSNRNLTVKPNGDQFAYFSKNTLEQRNSDLKESNLFDITRQPEAKAVTDWNSDKYLQSYQLSWRPGTSQIALYGRYRKDNSIILLNADTYQLCRLDIGGWAGVLKWSPDGRYLAAARAKEDLPIKSSDLFILDIATGRQYNYRIVPEEAGSPFGVTDIAWAPDNRHLAVLAHYFKYPPNQTETWQIQGKLYLLDFLSGKQIPISPEYQFHEGWWGTNMAWSPDGTRLLVSCYNELLRFCLITAQSSVNK